MNIQSVTSLEMKGNTTPFPSPATFKQNKKDTCVNVIKIYNGKAYLTLRHSRDQFPLNPHATNCAPHTLRMNAGRNGTSYLQRKVPYVPYSHIKYEN